MEEEKMQDFQASGEDLAPLTFCGNVERDIELHTAKHLAVLKNIPSLEMCCAHCNGNPKCGAWTWGKHAGVDDLTHRCFLKEIGPNEEPQRIKRFGVISGFPAHRLRKHGMVAELLGSALVSRSAPPASRAVCAGYVNVTGHGNLSVVAASWSAPGRDGAGVAQPRTAWEVEPRLGGRAYLAESCIKEQYQRGNYASLKLLGKTFRYTVDLSGAGCGCDARLSLVPMRYGTARSECGDFYCSARSDACGASCAEIAVQDANQYAWSSSLHAEDDAKGAGIGYGGGELENGRRDWNDAQYGPGAKCIDTSWPFRVEAKFPVNGDGDLQAMEITLTQDGHACSLHSRLDRYGEGRQGVAALGRVLAQGVTPVLQYAGSSNLAWLDGLGVDGQGPCVKDSPEVCPASVRFYGFSIEDRAVPSPIGTQAVRSSPLEVAFSDVHADIQAKAERKRRGEVLNATVLRQVGIQSVTDCGDDCSSAGVGVAIPGLGGKKSSGYTEQAQLQSEWQVLALTYVRSEHTMNGEIVGQKNPGQIIAGNRVGDWINLGHEPGFVPVFDEDHKPLLKERKVSYEKIVIGNCHDMDLHPILDESICKDAAFALGYFDSIVTAYHGEMKRPEGCYMLNGQVFLATNPANRGNGAEGGRMPLCASLSYPTTVTATTTTYTTTATTHTTATTTTSTTWGDPSLFCLEVMMTTTYEFGLVKEQIKRGAGIFTCDEYAVFSQDERTYLGAPPGGKPIHTQWFKKAFVGVSKDGTAGNTMLFMHLWEAVRKDGRWERHDWTIKADPDAVVLPFRIRWHLRKATGPTNYLVNCNKVPGNPDFPMIFGAFEAFSKPSLQIYFGGGDDSCRNELSWQTWGEDYFMHHCMKHLGIQEYDDFGILSDKRCKGADCLDGWAAAYHDFKDQTSWFTCWDQAIARR